MGRGRGRRRRRRRQRQQREKEAAIAPGNTSGAESFVRGRLGSTGGSSGSQSGKATGAATAPKTGSTTTSGGSFSTPSKRQMEGRPNPTNVIRFSPLAWSKLQWFRDRGNTEIGGFGISLKEEPLYVIDFITVKQQCTSAHVEFDDDDVARLLDEMDRKGYTPDEVLRIWLHTHPGNSASPSGTDVQTFRDVFGGSSWSIMVILAKGGECKAKLRYTEGPGAEMELKPQVDLHPPFEGVSGDTYKQWEDEYIAHVRTRGYTTSSSSSGSSQGSRSHSHGHGHGACGGSGYPHGYGGYGDEYGGDWWNANQNDDTSGFRPEGAGSSGSSGSSSSRSSGGSRTHHRLLDQTEIPPYGGMYRLASREGKKEMRLVNECVEQVWQVDDNDDKTKTIITDLSWYTFSEKARINADIGDDIDSIGDISDEAPVGCGEIAWRVNNEGKLLPMKITRVLSSGEVIDLRADEDVAAAELFNAKSKGGSSSSAASSADNTAGFAPAAGDKKDDDKDDDKETAIVRSASWNCSICTKPIDTSVAYLVKNNENGGVAVRAHKDCITDADGWMIVPLKPVRPASSSKKETEIITVNQASAAAAAKKESDEPGFGPASSDGDTGDGDGTGGDGVTGGGADDTALEQ